MVMVEPNWEQDPPTFHDIKKMWADLEITHDPSDDPAVNELLGHLRSTHENGGAEFARFAISPHPVLHWFGSRNRLEEIDFFPRLARHPSVVAAFSPLTAVNSEAALKLGLGIMPFTLAGELANTLVQGGAYSKFSGSAREAMNISSRFCDALFGDRFTEVLLFKTHEQWSDWFFDVAWDYTWAGFDKGECKVWLLCVTDTD